MKEKVLRHFRKIWVFRSRVGSTPISSGSHKIAEAEKKLENLAESNGGHFSLCSVVDSTYVVPWYRSSCLLYLHDTKPIDPECPPTKAESEAAGKSPEGKQKKEQGRSFEKLFKFDVDYLKSLDHYAVLGLKEMRLRRTTKRAYRKIVLKHFPDKRKSDGQDVKLDEDYFHCITMAYETLETLKKRHAFDYVEQPRAIVR